MINWEDGHYHPSSDAWRYLDGTFEILVPGNGFEPSAHWLRVAQGTMQQIDKYHAAARQYLDAFVDRGRFGGGINWEPQFIEFGDTTEFQNIRFAIYYRVVGDELGLWSVAFHPTNLPAPNDLFPVSFTRQQQ